MMPHWVRTEIVAASVRVHLSFLALGGFWLLPLVVQVQLPLPLSEQFFEGPYLYFAGQDTISLLVVL